MNLMSIIEHVKTSALNLGIQTWKEIQRGGLIMTGLVMLPLVLLTKAIVWVVVGSVAFSVVLVLGAWNKLAQMIKSYEKKPPPPTSEAAPINVKVTPC